MSALQFYDGRTLLARGVPTPAGWSQGLHPVLGALEVDDQATVDFVAAAQAQIKQLGTAVQQIGPPGMFDFGSSYGERFTPIYDAIADLQNRAHQALPYGSPAMASINQGLQQLLSALFKVRNDGTSDAWRAAVAVFTGNPVLALDVVRRTVASAGGLITDTGAATRATYVTPVLDFYRSHETAIKYGTLGLLGLALLNALGLLRR